MVELLICSAAEQDYAEALTWYADRDNQAAEGFDAEFDRAIQSIAEAPGRFPPVRRTPPFLPDAAFSLPTGFSESNRPLGRHRRRPHVSKATLLGRSLIWLHKPSPNTAWPQRFGIPAKHALPLHRSRALPLELSRQTGAVGSVEGRRRACFPLQLALCGRSTVANPGSSGSARRTSR